MRLYVSASLAILLFGILPACAADAPATHPKQVIPREGVEGRIDHMAVDEKGGRLFMAALGNNTVEVIDLVAGMKINTIKVLEEPQGIVFIPESGRLVVVSGGDSKCRIYDGSFKLLSQIDDLADADNVRYDAKAKQAIVGFGSGALAFIDPQTGTKVREIKLDGHPYVCWGANSGSPRPVARSVLIVVHQFFNGRQSIRPQAPPQHGLPVNKNQIAFRANTGMIRTGMCHDVRRHTCVDVKIARRPIQPLLCEDNQRRSRQGVRHRQYDFQCLS
jgi:hypothetical protein